MPLFDGQSYVPNQLGKEEKDKNMGEDEDQAYGSVSSLSLRLRLVLSTP